VQGAGLRFLSEPIASPTLASQAQEILAAFPQAKWHTYDAVNREQAYAGAALAFGAPVETSYRFDHAKVVVVLDDDVFSAGPGSVRYARDFANGRRVRRRRPR
jgi:molybdopterin-containing oxidoreductase family iron-sulfur binding subunit